MSLVCLHCILLRAAVFNHAVFERINPLRHKKTWRIEEDILYTSRELDTFLFAVLLNGEDTLAPINVKIT